MCQRGKVNIWIYIYIMDLTAPFLRSDPNGFFKAIFSDRGTKAAVLGYVSGFLVVLHAGTTHDFRRQRHDRHRISDGL